ncbi:putative Ig domain-containing protein [Oceanithermus sp.]
MRLRLIVALLLTLLAACGTEGGTAEPLRITVRSLPVAYVGEHYDARVPASGGIRPYQYELEGDLPEGITFAAGRFSGTPRKKGSFKLTLVVSDAALSSRSASYTLKVTDPPPPQLSVKQPGSETDAPFIAVFKLSDRPATALRLHLDLKNLKPNLESLRASPDLLYVVRYDPEKQTLDLDGAFTGVVRGVEVFRLELTPSKKLRPQLRPQVQFFNAKGEPYTPNPPKRPPDKGKYSFDDLRAIAAAWPRTEKTSKTKPKKETAQANTGSQEETQANPPAPEGKPAQTEPEAPKQTYANEGGQEQQVATGREKATLSGDLDKNGKVDEADLKLLRSSYAFNPGGKLTPAEPKPGGKDTEKKPSGEEKAPDNTSSTTEGEAR